MSQPFPYGDPPATQNQTQVLSIISFVLAAVSVIFLPIIFGPAAIILAIVGMTARHERLAKIALPVAVVCMLIGFALGYWVYTKTS